MRIAVFGATGRTGQHVVDQALERGHRVTAVVRNPAKLEQTAREELSVIKADLTDTDAVRDALAGHEVIISALGPSESGPSTICEAATRTFLDAARQTGTGRIVVTSAAGFHTDGDGLITRRVVKPILGTFLRHQFADMRAMEHCVMASEADWTILRPPQLTRGPLTETYRSARNTNLRGGMRVSRADLAHALIYAAEEPSTIHETVSIAN